MSNTLARFMHALTHTCKFEVECYVVYRDKKMEVTHLIDDGSGVRVFQPYSF